MCVGCAGSEKKDITGRVFGKLRVLSALEPNKHGQSRWLVQCECGSKPFSVELGRLLSGNTCSCKCLKREIVSRRMTAMHRAHRIEQGLSPDVFLSEVDKVKRAMSSPYRFAVYKRDGNKCVLCGNRMGLNAHHIFPWQTHHSLRYDPRFMISLCDGHHRFAHNGGDWKTINSDFQLVLLERIRSIREKVLDGYYDQATHKVLALGIPPEDLPPDLLERVHVSIRDRNQQPDSERLHS